jgi:hypothetical protein
MELFIKISLIIHIAAGSLALLSGLGAILFRNRVKIHKKFGIVYFYCMTIIFITAVYISVLRSNIFLFYVSFFSYYSCLTAYRALKLKRLHIDQKPGKLDWIIEAFFGFMHIGFVVVAGYILYRGNISFGIISLVFGILGLRGNQANIKRLRGSIEYRNYWLLTHISGMCASYIGAFTAFLVNNNDRFIHLPQIFAWLSPTIFLVPFIFYEVNKHQKKAGRFPDAAKIRSSGSELQ